LRRAAAASVTRVALVALPLAIPVARVTLTLTQRDGKGQRRHVSRVVPLTFAFPLAHHHHVAGVHAVALPVAQVARVALAVTVALPRRQGCAKRGRVSVSMPVHVGVVPERRRRVAPLQRRRGEGRAAATTIAAAAVAGATATGRKHHPTVRQRHAEGERGQACCMHALCMIVRLHVSVPAVALSSSAALVAVPVALRLLPA